MGQGTETGAQTPETKSRSDFIARYEDANRRFHALKKDGQAEDIHIDYGNLNYYITLAGGSDYQKSVNHQDSDQKELDKERQAFSDHLESLKRDNPKMYAALEEELGSFEEKLDSTKPVSEMPTFLIDSMKDSDLPSDEAPSFVHKMIDEEAAQTEDGLLIQVPTLPHEVFEDDVPVPLPENIAPPVMPPEDIAPPVAPSPLEAMRPPTQRVLDKREQERTQDQKFLFEEIVKEAEAIIAALNKPKNFNAGRINDYKAGLASMQGHRQELYQNVQSNLPRGSYTLGWRMVQFMRANKLLQNQAEHFINATENGNKPDIDEFRIAAKLERELQHKLNRWYEEYGKNWQFKDLVAKKEKKYKNKPQKLFKELKKYSQKLDDRAGGILEGEFWEALDNFNLAFSAFRNLLSTTPQADELVRVFSRQLMAPSSLKQTAGTWGWVSQAALEDYKKGIEERKNLKVKFDKKTKQFLVSSKRR